MDFRWYQVNSDNTSGSHSDHNNGWSEITIGDNNSDGNNDTIVRHTDYGPPQGADPAYELGVAAVTYGPDNNVTKFVSTNQDYELNTTVLYQGVTDANRYRRKTIRTSDNVTLDTSCYDRSKQWANTYDYNLYDNITGAGINLWVIWFYL